jgi:hypothetical protein
MHWRCPRCGNVIGVEERLDFGQYQECTDCDEVVQPHKFVVEETTEDE